MPDPIWKRNDISKTENRLIWFLIDVGGMGNVVAYGWQIRCSEAMGLHRITINRTVKKLVKKGLLRNVSKGQIEFNMHGFESNLPENYVPLKDHDGKHLS